MTTRVVITGLGAITPVGNTPDESWQSLMAGKSGIGCISLFDSSDFAVKIAGEVKGWNPAAVLPRKEVRRRDRYQLFGQAVVEQAVAHAGVTFETEREQERAGAVIGSAIGGMTSFSEELHNIDANGPRRMSPFGIPSFMTTTASSTASMTLGMTGASYIITSACATGADCIGHAFDQIRLGRMDVMLAGAAEAPILPNAVAGFDRLGACTHANDTPQQAMRPFDTDRGGLVISEGAAVVVMESLAHAEERGAPILAEVVGYGTSSDAFHMIAPHPEGKGAAKAIRQALADARLNADDVDYINAHGTATPLNDTMETLAIKHALGEEAYNVPVSSTKSMTGHAMGASAAMEIVFSVLALRDQVIPPTINLTQPDVGCDLDYVPNAAREADLDVIVSNAFGFGGHNAVLALRRFED